MGIGEIEFKLTNALIDRINNECQVIFILSRIRKYIESEGLKNDFPILNMFCNWSLHIQINDTKSVNEYYNLIINGKLGVNDLLKIFKCDFFKFLKIYNLPCLDENNFKSFENLLLDIYSSTPLIFKKTEKVKIWIEKKGENDYKFIF